MIKFLNKNITKLYIISLLIQFFLINMVFATSIEFQYIYDDTGQLVKVIDSDHNLVEYIYNETGNRTEIKRSIVSDLAIFNFTPITATPLTKITIQGQGFSDIVNDNLVELNGLPLPINLADKNNLNVTIPLGATTGQIKVTVAGVSALSDSHFIVLEKPILTGILPIGGVSNANNPISLTGIQISGENLTGSTFHFEPLFSPSALTVTASTIAIDGRSAILDFSVGVDVTGSFTLIAENSTGSSTVFAENGNTFLVLNSRDDEDNDGLNNGDENTQNTDLFNYDTDGDGFNDGDEVSEGSDPLDANSLPLSLAITFFSVKNQAAPGYREGSLIGNIITVLNQTAPVGEQNQIGNIYIIENRAIPVLSNEQAVSRVISIENTAQ